MKHFLQSAVFMVLSIIILCIAVGDPNIEKDAVTLKEAICIAEADAYAWQADAKIAQIISTDAGDVLESKNGKNGKRRCWNILFVSDKKEVQYSVFVMHGKTAYNREVQMPTYAAIDLEKDVDIDSTDAVRIAKKYAIGPVLKSEGWAVGYHFALQYLMDTETKDIALAMMVYGARENGNFCFLAIDPKSKEVISYMEQTGYSKNGRSIWVERLEK